MYHPVANGKRTPEQIEADRSKIAHWWLEKVTQGEMAKRLGITQQMISKEIKKLRREWQENSLADVGQRIGERVASLEHVKREAWRGWHRSLRTAKRQTSRKKDRTAGSPAPAGPPGSPPPPPTPVASSEIEATIVREDQTGDPRFLQVVIGVEDQLSRLQGMYPTTKDGMPIAAAQAQVVIVLPDNGRGDGTQAPAGAAVELPS